MERICPDCDLPMASEQEASTKPGEEEDLCWRSWHNNECQMPKVDWRARALAAEALLRSDEEWFRNGHPGYIERADLADRIHKILQHWSLFRRPGKQG